MRLHERLIEEACKTHGWNTGSWKKAFIRKCKENPYWDGEMSALRPDDEGYEGDGKPIQSEMHDIVHERWPISDAWRLVVEGEKEGWGYNVLVLELLEVEVTNGISEEKAEEYERFWWLFDGSSCFHLRVFHMDRFGVVRPFMTETTIYKETVEIHIRPENN